MIFEQFQKIRLEKSTREQITRALLIIKDFYEDGYVLTLRQLYYQMLSRNLVESSIRAYKNLGNAISKGRICGVVPWDAIEDRARYLRKSNSWDNPSDIIRSAAAGYNIDMWARQPYRVEVWIEKEALAGVIERTCDKYDIPFYPCKGYSSQSEQWRAGKRFARYAADNQKVVIFHLGDHDPSGLDMTRDNRERLSMFSGFDVDFRRIALNMDQIEEHNPPPNPAKETDVRAPGYIEQYGNESWELDALSPRVIDEIVLHHVEPLIDMRIWDEDHERLNAERRRLDLLMTNYRHVETILDGTTCMETLAGKIKSVDACLHVMDDLNGLRAYDLRALKEVAPFAVDIQERLGDVCNLLGEV